jgi:hypothetical protein
VTIIPLCIRCKHLKDGEPGAMVCEAFPDGILLPILLAKADHRQPYPGDHGVRFEPLSPIDR